MRKQIRLILLCLVSTIVLLIPSCKIGDPNISNINPPPTITSFSPVSGSVGTLITIKGSNLDSLKSFTVGNVTAIVVSNDGNQLVGLVMPGAVTGSVSVKSSGGTAIAKSNFTILPTSFPKVQQGGRLIPSDLLGIDITGYNFSVAISADGNTAIVGNVNYNNDVGAAWIFVRSGGVWTQQGAKLVGNDGGGYEGSSVAISADGNTAIVGGPYDNGWVGAAWVYTRIDGVWSQQGNKLVANDAIGKPSQGWSVSISADGNTAVVGGFFDNSFYVLWDVQSSIGAAWVYTRSGGVWTQCGNKLVGNDTQGGAAQGESVSISADGNTIIVGGSGDNVGIGAAWIYNRSGNSWNQQGSKLVANDAISIANYGVAQGTSVGISADGNTAIVGGNSDNKNTGAAWIYTRRGNAWSQQGNKLVGTGTGMSYYQGNDVTISADGNTAIICGFTLQIPLFNGMWTFTRSGNSWSQQSNKFNSSGVQLSGNSVSLSSDGTTLIINGTWIYALP